MSDPRNVPDLLTRSLRTNQLPAHAFEWYCSYLRAYDACDPEAYARFLADDCEMRGNNGPALQGKAAIIEALPQFWSAYAWGGHELLTIVGSAHHFAAEAINHYHRHDGGIVAVNASAFTVRNTDGLVSSVHFYGDAAALYAESEP